MYPGDPDLEFTSSACVWVLGFFPQSKDVQSLCRLIQDTEIGVCVLCNRPVKVFSVFI